MDKINTLISPLKGKEETLQENHAGHLSRVPKRGRDGSSGRKRTFGRTFMESEMGLRASQLQRLGNIKPVGIMFEDLRSLRSSHNMVDNITIFR